jgi:hypothetical protein
MEDVSMRMKSLVTLVLAFGLATAAAAADMTGVVVSADGQSITLRHDDGTLMTHQLAPEVTLRDADGVAVTPDELANRRVDVEIDEAARVTSIEVADADEAAMPPSGAEDRAAQAGDPAAPDPAGGEVARAELPDTASPVTLAALIGGALFAAAYATRAYRRR